MFKFLRKYNKWILAVGGVLLMITFLIPEAIQRFSQQAGASGAASGRVGAGEKVSAGELENAAAELRLLHRAGLNVPGLPIERSEHWFLLVREADSAGVVGTPAAVPEELVAQFALIEPNRRFVRQTLAKFYGVDQLLKLYETGGIYSDRRIINTADRMLHQVQIQSVVLQADEDRSDLQPTQEQLTEQFNKFAAVEPGRGEMGFGYKLPDRVKLEWLEVSADSVRRAVQGSAKFSGEERRLHWKRNPEGLFPAVEPPPAPIPQSVSDDLLNKLVKQQLDEIARFVDAQVQQSLRGVREVHGVYQLPENWAERSVKFSKMASDIQARFGVDIPRYEATGDRWLSATDIQELKGVGKATTNRFSQQAMNLSQLVAQAHEFNSGKTSLVQRDVPGPALRGSDGSVYAFRILDADKSHVPSSIDEVRDEVVKDLRRLDHYAKLREQVAALESEARESGLLSVALKHDTVVQPESPVTLCNRFLLQYRAQLGAQAVAASPLPVIGADRDTTEKIVDRARALPSDKPIDQVPEQDRTFVLDVPQKLSVMAVRIIDQLPLSRAQFQDLVRSGSIHYLLATEELRDDDSLTDAFGYDALAKRHNFQLNRSRGESEPDEAESTSPPLAAAR